MKELYLATERNNLVTDAINVSEDIFSGPLVGGVAVDIVVPMEARIAVFASGGSFYFKNGAGVTVPTTFQENDVELNPTVRIVKGGSTISVVSLYDIHFSVCFYK
jgi:stringent starvation protein B